MSIINDHINLVNINRPIDEVLLKAIKNPIKIKYAVITKEFDKDSVLKYFPTIIFKYIEDIDDMYVKYVKYKNKYMNLKKQLGGSNIDVMKENYIKINTHFTGSDICTIEDITIYNMINLTKEVGATEGFGGGFLLSGMVEDVECVFKLLKINEVGSIPDININEIGITNYISDYFINHSNKKLTDNFITFYHQKKCDKFLLQDYQLSKMISTKISSGAIPTTSTDINIMIVEKVDGDLRGFIMSKLIEKQFNKDGKVKELSGEEKTEMESKNEEIKLILDSVLFQIIYTLYIFKKEFGTFIHGDLHMGNILLKGEPLETKKYKINRYLDSDDLSDVTEYDIKLNTFGITPKIWDFATSYVGTVNNKIKEKEEAFINKYFNYSKGKISAAGDHIDDKLIYYPSPIKDNDIIFLLNSILLLSVKYYIPDVYISQLIADFAGKSIDRIFNIFLGKIEESYKDRDITLDNCDYFLDDK